MKGWGRKGTEGDIGKRGRQTRRRPEYEIHTREGIYFSFTLSLTSALLSWGLYDENLVT